MATICVCHTSSNKSARVCTVLFDGGGGGTPTHLLVRTSPPRLPALHPCSISVHFLHTGLNILVEPCSLSPLCTCVSKVLWCFWQFLSRNCLPFAQFCPPADAASWCVRAYLVGSLEHGSWTSTASVPTDPCICFQADPLYSPLLASIRCWSRMNTCDTALTTTSVSFTLCSCTCVYMCIIYVGSATCSCQGQEMGMTTDARQVFFLNKTEGTVCVITRLSLVFYV